MSEVTIDSLLFGLTGLLFIGLSIPLILERVPPNRYYGFRTSRTLSDPRIWYEVNRISGSDLFVAGALITFSSLTMLLFGQACRPKNVVISLLSVMVLSLTGVTWHGFYVLKRI